MNDDELDDLLRRSAPVSANGDVALTLRQQAILDNIVANPRQVRRPRRRAKSRRVGWRVLAPATAMLAAFVVVVVVVLNPLAAAPASAWGPVPLSYTASARSVEEVVDAARVRADEQPGGPAVRGGVSTSWNLSVADDGTPQRVVDIVPSVADLTWSADLSGQLVTTVGQPYRADGSGESALGDDVPEPGSLIDDRIYLPGEYPALVPDADLLDAEGFQALLLMIAPDLSSPGDALGLVQGLLSEWTLTTTQHADLLQALTVYDNLQVLGTTTDRLGREVVGISAPSSQDREATLLVSLATGRIVGIEHTVRGDADPLGVPAGTVISYTLWRDSP